MSLFLLATLGCNGDDTGADDTDTDTGEVTANVAPSAPTVSISPEDPTYNEALTCTATDGVDPDGDPVTTTLSWTVDGADAGVDGDTVPAESVLPWQTWACTAVSSDGELESDAVSAEVMPMDDCIGLGGNQFQMAAPNDFTGTYFQLGNTGAEMTLEGWFMLEDNGAAHTLFYKGDTGPATSNTLDYMLAVTSTGELHAAVGWSGSGDACAYRKFADAITWGEWFHLAMTYDSDNTRKVFLNGNLMDDCIATAKNPATNGPLTLGGHLQISGQNYYPSSQFSGAMDEVRVSSVVRYHDPFAPSPWFEPDADTMALYHINEGSGSTLIDASGNYDAMLFTDQWVGDESACDGYLALD